MGVSLNEVLLRVTGDASEGEAELAEMAAALEAFDQQEAEAEATINTRELRGELKSIERELRDFDHSHYDADVAVDIGDAEFELRILQKQLAALDRDDIEIDVELQQQVTGDIAALRARLAGLREEFTNTGTVVDRFRARLGGFGNGINDARVSLGPFSGGVRLVAASIGLLLPLIVAVVSQLAALAASAAYAVGGIGALGVAFSALLFPAVLLGIGVVQRFQEQADKAGTAAHRLQGAASGLADTFNKALGPGADHVLSGAASALRSLTPVIEGLRGRFTAFGAAVGQALAGLGREFSSPAWTQFFSRITAAATKATPLLTNAFVSLSRILRNIATAAMPSLLKAFAGLADGLRGIADSTSDIGKLRTSIEGMVSHTGDWLELAHQLGRVLLGFFKAAAPAGQDLVRSLSDGAERLADWVNSAEGTKSIRDFLDGMRPILDSIAQLLGKVVEATAAWASLIGPLLPPIIDLMSSLVGVITDVLNAISDLPGPISAAVGALLLFAGPVGIIRSLAGVLGKLGGALGRGLLFGGLGDALGGIASGAARALPVLGRLGFAAARVATGPLGLLVGAATLGTKAIDSLYDPIDSIIGRAVLFVQHGQEMATNIRNIGTNALQLAGGLKITNDGFKSAAQAVPFFSDALAKAGPRVLAFAQTVKRVGPSIATTLRQAGRTAASALAGGLTSGRGLVGNAAKTLSQAAIQSARQAGNAMRGVGASVGRLFSGGVNSAKGSASGAGSGIANAAKQAAGAAGRALSGVGRTVGGLFAQGISSAQGAASSAATTVGNAAVSAFQSVGGSVASAGAALAANFASGIRSGIGAAVAAASDLAGAVRSVLPGSEPKDKNSPLRNLAAAGAAVVGNVAAGMKANRGEFVRAARRAFDGRFTVSGPGFSATPSKGFEHSPSGPGSGREKKPKKPDYQGIIDGLNEILDALRSTVTDSVAQLGTLQGDLGETIKRIFAEGRTGFGLGETAIKSGDLQGSMVSGLPVESWLQQLVDEIQGNIYGVLDTLGAAALPSVAAAPATAVTPAAVGGGGDTHHHYEISGGGTGGEADATVVIAKIEQRMKKRGKSGKRRR